MEEKVHTKQSGGFSPIIFIVLVIVLVFFAIFLFAPTPQYRTGFETIDEVMVDASQKDEFAPLENNDFRAPTWEKYQKKHQPSFFAKKLNNLLALLGLKARPAWSPGYFKTLVESQYKKRKAKGYKADYAIRISPSANSRFLIWGDLTGAYHSLARGIKKAIDIGILKNNLTLERPKDDYIVFMGDAPGRSPFLMEMTSLMLTLMERNPGRVIYLMGNTERLGEWHPYGMQEEFAIKANDVGSVSDLTEKLDKFYTTLPLAAYASLYPHDTKDFIRFSHYAMETPSYEAYQDIVEKLDDRYFSAELLEGIESGKEKVIPLEKPVDDPDKEQVRVRGIIKSFKKRRHYKPSDGIQFLTPDRGATAWFFLSSPVVIVKKIAGFHYDAFGVLQLRSDLDDATLTLYSKDVDKKDSKWHSREYNFLSGKVLKKDGKPVSKALQKADPMFKVGTKKLKKKKKQGGKKKRIAKGAKNIAKTRIRR